MRHARLDIRDELFEARAVHDANLMAIGDGDEPVASKVAHAAAHGFERQAQIVCDVGAAHWYVDECRELALRRHAFEHAEEHRDPPGGVTPNQNDLRALNLAKRLGDLHEEI